MIDPTEVSAWFRAHAPALILYARQWLPRAGAEDAVQEVFVRLLRQPRTPDNPRAWLFRAVRNESIGKWRTSKRRDRIDRENVPPETWFESPGPDRLDAETATEMLTRLPESQREAVVLRIWGGLTLKEIADLTGAAVSTVFHNYQQGLQAVRERMGVECESKKS